MEVGWRQCRERQLMPPKFTMHKYLLLIFGFVSLMAISSGCSHLYSHQTQTTITNGVQHIVTTDLRTITFFDSKSDLAKYVASQGSTTQRLGIGSLSAESSGTNAVELIDRIVQAVVKAAITSAKP